MSTDNNQHEQVLQLLITGGFLNPDKLQQARDIISSVAPSPGDNQSLESEIETEAAEYATGMMGIGEYNEKNWAYADKQTWHLIKRTYMRAAWKHPSRPSIDIVDELRKANPWNQTHPLQHGGYNECCNKLQEILNKENGKGKE